MQFRLKVAGGAAAAFFLSGCVTYPYETAFSQCDDQAAYCYRSCEAYGGGIDYRRCHDSCERQVDRCFDQAYSPYSTGYGYGYGSPWTGRYGSWYPNQGYSLSWLFFNQ